MNVVRGVGLVRWNVDWHRTPTKVRVEIENYFRKEKTCLRV